MEHDEIKEIEDAKVYVCGRAACSGCGMLLSQAHLCRLGDCYSATLIQCRKVADEMKKKSDADKIEASPESVTG